MEGGATCHWLEATNETEQHAGAQARRPWPGGSPARVGQGSTAKGKNGTVAHRGTAGRWHAVTSYYRPNLAGAGQRVGIQIRVFQEDQPPQHVLDEVLSCVRNEKLLPEITTKNSSSNTSQAVLVTSLNSRYYEKIRDEFDGKIAGVYQPSHEGRQKWDDTLHDMRALSEMYLLSMSDVLVTSGFSTFGYVAQGLGGQRPWIMRRPSPRVRPCL